MAKRCKHEFQRVTFKDGWTSQWMGNLSTLDTATSFGDVLSVRCDDCGVQLSLGESDEAPVAMEIRAVSMANDWLVGQELRGYAPADWNGWAEHEHPIGEMTERESAGWLARELVTHGYPDRDATAWPWDSTRPVAGQFEAWVAKADRAIEAAGSDAPTLASTTPLLAIVTAGVGAAVTPMRIAAALAIGKAERDAAPSRALQTPLAPWICPVASQECAIRRKCTNKCDPAGIEASLDYLDDDIDTDPPTDPATKFGDLAAQVTITLGPPEDLETMLDGEPLIDGIYTERQLTDAIAAEDAMRDPAVTARNAERIREQTRHDVAASYVRHDGMGKVTVSHGGGYDPSLGRHHPSNQDPTLMDAAEYEAHRNAEPDCQDEAHVDPVGGES